MSKNVRLAVFISIGLLVLFGGVFAIGITYQRSEINAAQVAISSKPPFSIQQCDDWLKMAKDNAYQNEAFTHLASACYQSHLVKR